MNPCRGEKGFRGENKALITTLSLFQNRNALRSEKAGLGLKLAFSDITADTLHAKIEEILSHNRFAQKAQEISHVFRSNPVHPMDNALFHIEEVMRNKGAKYLKSAAVKLSWYEHLLLDVMAFFALLAFTALAVIYTILKVLYGLVKPRKQKRE